MSLHIPTVCGVDVPRELDANYFDDIPIESAFVEAPPTAGAGISKATAEYLFERTKMFQMMTQKKGAPMVYGAQKKEKR